MSHKIFCVLLQECLLFEPVISPSNQRVVTTWSIFNKVEIAIAILKRYRILVLTKAFRSEPTRRGNIFWNRFVTLKKLTDGLEFHYAISLQALCAKTS